jgi:hypothetical protein
MGVENKMGARGRGMIPAIAGAVCDIEPLVAKVTTIVLRFRNVIADGAIKKAPCRMPKRRFN